MRLVLTVDPQHYLYGLGEVPSSWPVSALKTQAIAARTYAFRPPAQHRAVCDCALYASSYDQVYAGWDKEGGVDGDRWVAAVNQTDGQVVLNGGTTIQAFYMSSSGGYTENNENVWGGTPIDYLRGVCDPGDYTSANPNATWIGPSRRVRSPRISGWHRHGDRVHQRRSRRLGPDPVGHRPGRERSGLDQRRALRSSSVSRTTGCGSTWTGTSRRSGRVRRARLLPGLRPRARSRSRAATAEVPGRHDLPLGYERRTTCGVRCSLGTSTKADPPAISGSRRPTFTG